MSNTKNEPRQLDVNSIKQVVSRYYIDGYLFKAEILLKNTFKVRVGEILIFENHSMRIVLLDRQFHEPAFYMDDETGNFKEIITTKTGTYNDTITLIDCAA